MILIIYIIAYYIILDIGSDILSSSCTTKISVLNFHLRTSSIQEFQMDRTCSIENNRHPQIQLINTAYFFISHITHQVRKLQSIMIQYL